MRGRRWAPRLAVAGLLLVLAGGDPPLRAGGNIELVSDNTIRNRFWDSRMFPIRYRLNQNSALGFTAASIKADLDAAFAAWETVPDIDLDFEWGGTSSTRGAAADGENVLVFDPSSDPGDLVAFAPCSSLTAEVVVVDSSDGIEGNGLGRIDLGGGGFVTVPVGTYGPGTNLDCDIVFNVFRVPFTNDGTAGTEDIQGITTHESGHWHSLSHTPFPEATMYPFTDTNPPGDMSTGQSSLEPDDAASTGHLYKTAAFDAAHGTITGRITINGQPGDGAHVAALRVSDLKPVAGRFSLSRFLNGEDVVDGADFLAEGSGFYRLDGLPPGDYYVCAEWFDSTDEFLGRLENRYNVTVANSSIADGVPGAFAGTLGFRPERFECHNTDESADGGDGATAGAAADNPDAAAPITVTAGNVVPGVDIQINLDPDTGKTAAARQNPTGVDRASLTPLDDLTPLRIGTDGTDDDYFILEFPPAILPPPPFNIIDGIWIKFGRSDAPYTGALLLGDPVDPNFIEPAIVWDARRMVTGWDGGQTGITELLDVRDRFNVTINEPRSIFMVFKLPQSPPGIGLVPEGYFTLANDTLACSQTGGMCVSDADCPGANNLCVGNATGRTLFTNDNFNTFFATSRFDVVYSVRTETAPAVRITSATPAVLSAGATGTVVTVGGDGFQPGAQVEFLSPTFGPPQASGVTVTGVTFVSSTTLEATVDVDPAAPVNFLDVQVTNPEVLIPNRARLMAVNAVDSDGDGTLDPQDCAPDDGSVWSLPGPVASTLAASAPAPGTVQLDWSPPDQPGATSVTFDVVSGDAATLRASGGADYGTCLSPGQAATSLQDATALAAGEIRQYMVAARNGCGPGTYDPELPAVGLRDADPDNCP